MKKLKSLILTALLVLLPPLPGSLRRLGLLFGGLRVGSPPLSHPFSRPSITVGPHRIIVFCHASSLYFRITFVLTAIPLQSVAFVKAERSPRLAARIHAVVFKQPDWRFLHVGRVRTLLGQPNWFVAHLSLRSRIASISAILCPIALTAS